MINLLAYVAEDTQEMDASENDAAEAVNLAKKLLPVYSFFENNSSITSISASIGEPVGEVICSIGKPELMDICKWMNVFSKAPDEEIAKGCVNFLNKVQDSGYGIYPNLGTPEYPELFFCV